MTPKINNIPQTNMQELRDSLEEDTTYLVEVAVQEDNVIHESILLMGFTSGGYCQIYNNTYEYPEKMDDCFYIKVIKKLTKMKK